MSNLFPVAIYQLVRVLDLNTYTENGESSMEEADTRAFIHFSVHEKYQSLTPPSNNGSRTIFSEEDGLSMTKVFPIEFSELFVSETTGNRVLEMLSSLSLIPPESFENIKEKVADHACEAARTALETRVKTLHIGVEVDVLFKEEYDDDDGLSEDGEVVLALPASGEQALETKKSEEGETGGTCMICLEELILIGVDVMQMPCSHSFHDGCIAKWLENKNSCPLCRFEMPTKP